MKLLDIHRWRLRASGRVQGVGYRERVRRAAALEGVTGTVQNRPDGTVEIEAQGPRDRLARWLERISGPWGASDANKVERIAELTVKADEKRFDVIP